MYVLQTHQAHAAKTIRVIVDDILATWMGDHYHDVLNTHHFLLGKLLRTGRLGQGLKQPLFIQVERDTVTFDVLSTALLVNTTYKVYLYCLHA